MGEHRCPVGCCNPHTFEAVAVPSPTHLCERHYGKLSHPLAERLAGIREHGDDEDLARVLKAAISEARHYDDGWYHFGVRIGSLVEPHEGRSCTKGAAWESAVRRWASLRDESSSPALLSGATGEGVPEEQILVLCPWRIIGVGGVLGQGPTLNKAIAQAGRNCTKGGRIVWPEDVAPSCVNDWTGDELPWADALALARRGTA